MSSMVGPAMDSQSFVLPDSDHTRQMNIWSCMTAKGPTFVGPSIADLQLHQYDLSSFGDKFEQYSANMAMWDNSDYVVPYTVGKSRFSAFRNLFSHLPSLTFPISHFPSFPSVI